MLMQKGGSKQMHAQRGIKTYACTKGDQNMCNAQRGIKICACTKGDQNMCKLNKILPATYETQEKNFAGPVGFLVG